MSVELNHTIVPSRNQAAAAAELAEMLGLEATKAAHFDAVFGRIQERNLPYWADPRRTKAQQTTRCTAAAASTGTARTGTTSRS